MLIKSYDQLEITWEIIDQIDELDKKGINTHNRSVLKKAAKKHGCESLMRMLDYLSKYNNAKHVWQHVIEDIENGFEMPYIQKEIVKRQWRY